MILADDEETHIEITKLRLANNQAAEYSSALLNEKTQLKLQHEKLEDQHESLKLELDHLKTQLKTFQVIKHEEILKNETDEETLLNERKTHEDYLIKKVTHYEQEVRLLKQDNERLNIENENLLLNSQELTKQIDELNEIKLKLKYDLKESKSQEQRLIDANTELEEDNVLFEQQLQRLKEKLIDYDGLKVENKRFQENIDDLHRMMKELESLKAITESQFIELHNNLRDERDQKHIYKQRLDQRIEQESLRNLDSIRMTLNDINSDDDDESSCIPSPIDILEIDHQAGGNLFSEIHGNEIRRLEHECSELSQIKSSLDNELLIINEKTKILSQKIQQINENSFPSKEFNTNNLLIHSIEQMDILIKKNLTDQEKSDEQERTIYKLKQDLNVMMKQSNERQTMFIKTHDNLINLSDELENIHSYIFISNDLSIPPNDIQIKKRQLINSNNKIIDLTMHEYILDILQEQVKQLKQSFDNILDYIKQSSTNEFITNNDIKELQDQNIKQRLLLTTKGEQIGTLRKLLKENKQTAEIALANLKLKYENEKLIVTETMSKLRNELKLLKEDAVTFASLHTKFSARCDEYVKELNESLRQLQSAEEEKRTLNSLLRMAIEQKLILTQKLEDLEIDNERSNNSSRRKMKSVDSKLPTDSLTIAPNIINENNSISKPRRGRFIPPRMMRTFRASTNQETETKR